MNDEDEDLTPEERAFAEMVSASLNLFVIPAPPENLTPRMAQIALRRLIRLDQELGQETMGDTPDRRRAGSTHG